MQGLGGELTLIRPKTGKFHDKLVALDLRINYLGMDAIAGKMTIMQAYDSTNLQAETPESATSDPNVVRLSGGVIAGHRIKFTEPTYPEGAKIAHLSGTVLLHAVVGKDGSIGSLVPIASTDSIFTSRLWRLFSGGGTRPIC